MQGAAVKTAAPHSAIFLSRSGVWRLWLLPYFGAERQIIVHRLMKLFLQALHVFGLKVHQIVDAEEPSEEDSILGGVFGPRRIPLLRHRRLLHSSEQDRKSTRLNSSHP